MSFRRGFRPLNAAFQSFRNASHQGFGQFGRRWQSATATAETPKEKLNPFSWNSPVGPKTVHFWAPVMKWILVGVSITDFTRPAEQLSLTQCGALMATGAIWTRWCLIIKPKNYLLATVNFFLFLANGVQVGRAIKYQRLLKDTPLAEQVKGAAVNAEKSVEGAVVDAKNKVATVTK